MIRLLQALILVAVAASPLQAAREFPAPAGPAERTLVIRSATDLFAIEPLIAGFQRRHPWIGIRYEEHNTNELYESMQDACAGHRPVPDLVISSAVDQQVKLVNDGCALAVASPLTDALPDWARWRREIFGLTFEPVVIVYNRQALPADSVPQTRFDLVDLLRARPDALYGRVATYDIEQSGVGYLFAFEDARQASTYGRLVESFGRIGVVPLCCTALVLDGVSDGRYTLGYNVLGSYAIARARRDPRIGVVFPQDYTLVLTRAAFIPVGAADPEAARQFIDFALSEDGRRILTHDSLLFSAMAVREALRALEDLVSSDEQSLRPIALSPELIVGLDRSKRALFLRQWRDSVGATGRSDGE